MRINELVSESDQEIQVAYHITTVDDAEDIMAVGLIPYNRAGHDWYSGEERAYLIADKRDIGQVRSWIESKLASEGDHDTPLTLLKIDVSGLPIKYDGNYHYSTKPITPDRITDLGPRTLNGF